MREPPRWGARGFSHVRGAERVGLPKDPGKLAGLVSDNDLARLSAALVRVSLDRKLAADVRAA